MKKKKNHITTQKSQASNLPEALETEFKEALDSIPEDKREIVMTFMMRQQMRWEAPYLPPEIIQRFDTIKEGGGAQVMEHFEKEQQHRHQMQRLTIEIQKTEVDAIAKVKDKAVLYGFVTIMTLLSFITLAGYLGLKEVVYTLGGVGITTAIGGAVQFANKALHKSK